MKKLTKVLAKVLAKLYVSISKLKNRPRKARKFNPLVVVAVCMVVIIVSSIAGIASVNRQYRPTELQQTATEEGQVSSSMDAMNIIGNSFAECEEIFGKSEQVVQENICYYKLIGATILFDKKTNEALSVGIDTQDVSEKCAVYGLYVGESVEDATEELANKDIELILDGEGSFSTVFENKGCRYKLFLNSEDGVITWVRVTFVG